MSVALVALGSDGATAFFVDEIRKYPPAAEQEQEQEQKRSEFT